MNCGELHLLRLRKFRKASICKTGSTPTELAHSVQLNIYDCLNHIFPVLRSHSSTTTPVIIKHNVSHECDNHKQDKNLFFSRYKCLKLRYTTFMIHPPTQPIRYEADHQKDQPNIPQCVGQWQSGCQRTKNFCNIFSTVSQHLKPEKYS